MKGMLCFWGPLEGVPMTRRRFWANAVPWVAGSFGALAFCVARKGAVPATLHWVALCVALMTLVTLDTSLRARLRHAGWPPALVGWALFSVAVGCFLTLRAGVAPWVAWGPAALLSALCLVGACGEGAIPPPLHPFNPRGQGKRIKIWRREERCERIKG